MKAFLDLLTDAVPVSIALLAAAAVYLVVLFYRFSRESMAASRQQAEDLKGRFDVVDKSVGVFTRTIDQQEKEIAKLRNDLKIAVDSTKQQEGRLDEQELVIYSMSASIYLHLWHIHRGGEYLYRDQEWFRRQMFYLSDNGYIQPVAEPFLIFDRSMDGKNLAEVAKLTPVGKLLVELRGQPPEL